jgi:hypothetical protein
MGPCDGESASHGLFSSGTAAVFLPFFIVNTLRVQVVLLYKCSAFVRESQGEHVRTGVSSA